MLTQASLRWRHHGPGGDRLLYIVFLILAAALIIRFVRTGGVAMLRMMGGSPDSHDSHDHMDAHASHVH